MIGRVVQSILHREQLITYKTFLNERNGVIILGSVAKQQLVFGIKLTVTSLELINAKVWKGAKNKVKIWVLLTCKSRFRGQSRKAI